MYNLAKILWPCNNKYIPPCEDSVYDMTKGLAQRFLIGRSIDPESDPNTMECKIEPEENAEIKEEDIIELPPMPADDVYLEETRDKYKSKCEHEANMWTDKPVWKNEYEMIMKPDIVAQALEYSDDFAWYLRKCCARSARIGLNPETEEAKNEREEKKKECLAIKKKKKRENCLKLL